MKTTLNTLFTLALMVQANAQSVTLPTDRARITVATIPDAAGGPAPLKVLRTDYGTPLRAGTAWLWSKAPEEQPGSYYAELRGKGFNAVRIILFDTWEKEAGYGNTDWNDPTYRSVMLARIDRAVNYCSRNGLYAIINSHNKIPEYNSDYNNNLWRSVARYFAGRTNVIYEASNEPIPGTGTNAAGEYADSVARLQQLRDTYGLIRGRAPNTHIMLLTPAGVSGWGYIDGLARLAKKFVGLKGIAIDWTKTSLAYHLYHADENLWPQAQNLRNFHSQFPGWPSENNFPKSVTSQTLGIDPTDDWRSVSFGTDTYLAQTCERLGLGWSQWHIEGSAKLNRNFPLIWADAVAKKYTWNPDPVVNADRIVNAGGPSVGAFGEDINFWGGTVATNAAGVVDTKGVKNAAPADVYQTERYGDFSYQFSGLLPNRKYYLRLHFAENYSGITAAGQRLFSVYFNNVRVLNRCDVYALAGNRRNRAVVREIIGTTDAQGRINLRFESIVQNALVNGIEIVGPTP